jgi:hypothetical protein
MYDSSVILLKTNLGGTTGTLGLRYNKNGVGGRMFAAGWVAGVVHQGRGRAGARGSPHWACPHSHLTNHTPPPHPLPSTQLSCRDARPLRPVLSARPQPKVQRVARRRRPQRDRLPPQKLQAVHERVRAHRAGAVGPAGVQEARQVLLHLRHLVLRPADGHLLRVRAAKRVEEGRGG